MTTISSIFPKKRTLSQLPTNNDVFHSSTSDLCVWCRFCAQILLLASIRCRVYGVDSVRKFFYCWCEPVYMVPILGTNFIFIVTHEAVAYMVLAYKVTNGFYRVSFYQFLWDVITARAFFFFFAKFCNRLCRIFGPLDNLCCKLDFRFTRRHDSA